MLKGFSFRFQLKNSQNIPGCGINAMKGCTFFVDKIEPILFEVEDGPNLQSGKFFPKLRYDINHFNGDPNIFITILTYPYVYLLQAKNFITKWKMSSYSWMRQAAVADLALNEF